MKIFNVFVRHHLRYVRTYSGYESDDYADIVTEDYIGTFDSQRSADVAARDIDISIYNSDINAWKPSAADAWKTFTFVLENEMNRPIVDTDVSEEADRVASSARKKWKATPAGMEYLEKLRRSREAYAERQSKADEKRAADARDVREKINAKARATRAAKKAASS